MSRNKKQKPDFITEADKANHIELLRRMVDGLKKELGDGSAEMFAVALGNIDEKAKEDYIRTAVESAYDAGHMQFILPERPKITFRIEKDKVIASPANESALRIMQTLNQAYFLEFAKMDKTKGAKH